MAQGIKFVRHTIIFHKPIRKGEITLYYVNGEIRRIPKRIYMVQGKCIVSVSYYIVDDQPCFREEVEGLRT